MTEDENTLNPRTRAGDVTFTIRCSMRPEWVPHFLGMLAKMQWLGNAGSSRQIIFMADGDGNFRPRFVWPNDMPKPAEGQGNEKLYFDAG